MFRLERLRKQYRSVWREVLYWILTCIQWFVRKRGIRRRYGAERRDIIDRLIVFKSKVSELWFGFPGFVVLVGRV